MFKQQQRLVWLKLMPWSPLCVKQGRRIGEQAWAKVGLAGHVTEFGFHAKLNGTPLEGFKQISITDLFYRDLQAAV